MTRRRDEPRKPKLPSRWPTETQRLEADWLARSAGRELERALQVGKRRVTSVPNALLRNVGHLRCGLRVDLLVIRRGPDKRCSKCRQPIPSTGSLERLGIYNVVLPDRKLTEREIRAEIAQMRTLARLVSVRHYGIIYRGIQVPRWVANKVNRAGAIRAIQGS